MSLLILVGVSIIVSGHCAERPDALVSSFMESTSDDSSSIEQPTPEMELLELPGRSSLQSAPDSISEEDLLIRNYFLAPQTPRLNLAAKPAAAPQLNLAEDLASAEQSATALAPAKTTKDEEQKQFEAFMSSWWKNHRQWMKRHNIRLFEELRDHRQLSRTELWKPFLLRWHYVQSRVPKGFRYRWLDDGTYETKRFLMQSKRNSLGQIRSVNNICFPGYLAPAKRQELCHFSRRVSSRAVQFTLGQELNAAPVLSVLRSYASFTPGAPRATDLQFVNLQGLRWNLEEVVEYCDTRKPEQAVPVGFSQSSAPTSHFALKDVKWKPLKVSRELLKKGVTVDSILMESEDSKFRVKCAVPLEEPETIYLETTLLSQLQCRFTLVQWPFSMQCPLDKLPSLALVTKMEARSPSGIGDGLITLTPTFQKQLTFNGNKGSMQFEEAAVLHEGEKRTSVPVSIYQPSKNEWNDDPKYRSARHLYFSFIVSDFRSLQRGTLDWDFQMTASFSHPPKVLNPKLLQEDGVYDVPEQAQVKDPDTVLVQPTSSSAASIMGSVSCMFPVLIGLAVTQRIMC